MIEQYIIQLLMDNNKTQIDDERIVILRQKQFVMQQILRKQIKEADLVKGLERVVNKIKQYTFSYLYFIVVHGFFKAIYCEPRLNDKIQILLATIVGLVQQIDRTVIKIQSPQVQQAIESYKPQNHSKIDIPEQQVKLSILHSHVSEAIVAFDKKKDVVNKTIDQLLQFKIKADEKPDVLAYRQFFINYMKMQLDILGFKYNQASSKRICCKCLFTNKQFIDSREDASQEFKRYVWPIRNANIETHIAKTIAGFMNSKGGIIYIGIMENKQKRNEVVGIELTSTTVKQLKTFMIDRIVKSIYPQHWGFDDEFAKTVKNVPDYKYIINDYISMEFLPVADADTLTNIRYRSNANQIIDLLMVKIIVKIGHPKHLYHLVNNERSLDFYERGDRNVEKIQFPEAYKKIYDRLDKFQQCRKNLEELEIGRMQFHFKCRYTMHIEHMKLKEDQQNQDSEDDY